MQSRVDEFERRKGMAGMRDWKDRLGIFASAACAVHCAATPLLVAALPTLKLTEWMADPRFHQVVAVLCCGLVAISIVPIALRYRNFRLFSLASTGLGLILAAAFLAPENCCSLEPHAVAVEHEDHDHASHDHASHDDAEHGHSHPDESPTLLMAGLSIAHPWMTPVGGLLLIIAHALNMRRRWKSERNHPNCCAADHDAELIAMPGQRSVDTSLADTSLARAS